MVGAGQDWGTVVLLHCYFKLARICLLSELVNQTSFSKSTNADIINANQQYNHSTITLQPTMTPEFEARLKKAVDERVIPAAVVLARDKSGMTRKPLSGPISSTAAYRRNRKD